MLGPAPVAQAQSPSVSYVYDELGRLTGVVDTTGQSATYSYDAAGNLVAISRGSAGQVSIIEFTPNSGPEGTPVTIFGTAFSATSAQNEVRFNGVLANVSSSSTTQIIAAVPAGATTGAISVTSPNGSATSSAPFTVTGSQAPTISGFTPSIGLNGVAVTVNGTNFQLTPASNRVVFNVATVAASTATATSISTSADGGGSGRIAVSTPYGKAVSAADFYIPPPSFTVAQVLVQSRLAIGQTQAFTIGTADKIGLILFDGLAGQRVAVGVSSPTVYRAKLSLLRTDGTTLLAKDVGTISGAAKFLDTTTLPAEGTYTLLFDPYGTYTGSLTLTLYDVPPDPVASITAGGAAVSVTAAAAGQNPRLMFSGSADQRVSLNMTGVTIGTSFCCSTNVSILKPDGSALVNPTLTGTDGGFLDAVSLPSAGTYTVLVDPIDANTGDMTLALYDVPPDPSPPIVAGGAPVTLTLTVAGQNGRPSFSGSAGQRVSLKMSAVTIGTVWCCSSYVSIRKPDGSALVSPMLINLDGAFFDPVSLPTTGSYTILVDPLKTNTGGITLTLYEVPADLSGSIAIGGAAVTVTTTVPGQNAQLTFTGSASQRVTLALSAVTIGTSWCCSTKVSIKKPDGSNLVNPTNVGTSGGTIGPTTLPAAGTYTILVDPLASSTGSMTLTLTNAP